MSSCRNFMSVKITFPNSISVLIFILFSIPVSNEFEKTRCKSLDFSFVRETSPPYSCTSSERGNGH